MKIKTAIAGVTAGGVKAILTKQDVLNLGLEIQTLTGDVDTFLNNPSPKQHLIFTNDLYYAPNGAEKTYTFYNKGMEIYHIPAYGLEHVAPGFADTLEVCEVNSPLLPYKYQLGDFVSVLTEMFSTTPPDYSKMISLCKNTPNSNLAELYSILSLMVDNLLSPKANSEFTHTNEDDLKNYGVKLDDHGYEVEWILNYLLVDPFLTKSNLISSLVTAASASPFVQLKGEFNNPVDMYKQLYLKLNR